MGRVERRELASRATHRMQRMAEGSILYFVLIEKSMLWG